MKTTEVCFKAEIKKVDDSFVFDFQTTDTTESSEELWQKAQQSVSIWLEENEDLIQGHKIALKLKDRIENYKN